jgi:hypothetical protein
MLKHTFLLLAALASCAHAVTLDWDSVNWPEGGLTRSFNVDGVAGNDITITISGNTGYFDGATRSAPDDAAYDANYFESGLSSVDGGTGQQALNTRVDWTNNTSTLTFTITFIGNYSSGVYLNQLALFDVDRTTGGGVTWIDRIYNIYGATSGGTIVAPSSVTGTLNNVVTGSGTNFVITGTNNAANNTANANAYISFADTNRALTQVTFTWGNAAGTQSNPASQIIALGDFSWTAAPEVGSSLAALLLCGSLLGSRLFRHRRS